MSATLVDHPEAFDLRPVSIRLPVGASPDSALIALWACDFMPFKRDRIAALERVRAELPGGA